jgi:2-oxoglutarate dehydrogenase E1 component
MSPKSLLRHPAATSRLDVVTSGAFMEIIDDPARPEKVERVFFCSGKVYYDLCDYRDRNQITGAAIVRIEQLYPLHRDQLAQLEDDYSGARIVWCQEEPQNMGAWSFIAPHFMEVFGFAPLYAGRDAAASPAVGALALHKFELAAFLHDAFKV